LKFSEGNRKCNGRTLQIISAPIILAMICPSKRVDSLNTVATTLLIMQVLAMLIMILATGSLT